MEKEQQQEPEKHWLSRNAEELVAQREKYKYQTWHHENVDLYSMFYGALTSIMEYKQAPSKTVQEVKDLIKAFEDAKPIIRG